MEILVTNDDGIRAEGIGVLAKAAAKIGNVSVVAPADQQSATSHAITLGNPLRMDEVRPGWMSVSGTPTDCVLLSVNGLLPARPELVLSGINHGPNMGHDVIYSGTVAAAVEGTMLGVPSIAFSLHGRHEFDFEAARRFVPDIIRAFLNHPPPPRTYWNVNFPELPAEQVQGIRITRLGERVYRDVVVRKVDPRGRPYYWIGGDTPTFKLDEGTDFRAINDRFITISPLHLDPNDYKTIEHMRTREWPEGGAHE